jgi:hypothetical protein
MEVELHVLLYSSLNISERLQTLENVRCAQKAAGNSICPGGQKKRKISNPTGFRILVVQHVK